MCNDGRHGIDPVDEDLTEYHKQTVDISISASLSLDTPKLQPNYKPKYPSHSGYSDWKIGTLLNTLYFLGKSQIQQPSSTKQKPDRVQSNQRTPFSAVKSLTHQSLRTQQQRIKNTYDSKKYQVSTTNIQKRGRKIYSK